MMQVNLAEAGTDFSKFIHLLQSGQETTIIFAEKGKPDVKMEYIQEKPKSGGIKIGIAKGELIYHGDFDECNDEIAEMFGVVPCPEPYFCVREHFWHRVTSAY